VLPHLGERVDASRPVLSIVPEDAELQAHLYIPTRAIGFVQEGQAVRLRYDAYPYQRFGIYEGVITQVSNAVLTQNEIPLLAVKEPVYKVIASLSRQSVTAYGVEVPLKPGILLSADVELDNRSLIEWLLDPLYSLQGKL
jgi:membrane fusion protein